MTAVFSHKGNSPDFRLQEMRLALSRRPVGPKITILARGCRSVSVVQRNSMVPRKGFADFMLKFNREKGVYIVGRLDRFKEDAMGGLCRK